MKQDKLLFDIDLHNPDINLYRRDFAKLLGLSGALCVRNKDIKLQRDLNHLYMHLGILFHAFYSKD